MKKQVLAILLGAFMVMSLMACGVVESAPAATAAPASSEAAESTEAKSGEAKETTAAAKESGAEKKSDGKTVYLNFAHNRSEDDPFGVAVKKACDMLYKATDGAYAFQIYPHGTYAALGDAMEAVSGGTLDFAWFDTGMDYAERLGVLLSPFCFDSYDHWLAFKKSDVYKEFVQDMSNTCNVHHFGFFTFGFRMVTGNEIWKTPEDFASVKLRMAVQPPYPEIAKVLNCTGEPLDANEVYTALQTGVFDGQENPYSDIISRKFYEVQKYIIKTEHVLSVGGVACSNKCWNSLDAVTRAAVTDAVNYILDYVDSATIDGVEEQEKFLQDQGCEIVSIEDKTPFKNRAYLVFEKYPEFEDYYKKIQAIEY